MSDHLLRLSRVVLDKERAELPADCTTQFSRELSDLVRDLEAAPAPERRPITREQWIRLCLRLGGWAGNWERRDSDKDEELLREILSTTLGLTVEDA